MSQFKKYNPSKIESKWQKYWESKKIYRANDISKKPKYYQLETFPYPSGAGLHAGHPKGYIAEDIHARYSRMNGKEVLYTMGWDAFGLPTENYAIKIGKSPQNVARANIKNFTKQVKMFGLSYDWDREINTSSPEYYKWTQWLFIQLFKKGLAYQKLAKVNWCPKDQTVLANEQVVDGKCERCGSLVEQKEMKQWFFKITDYAERLLEDLDGLDWPKATVKRQQDWIGKSDGARLRFDLKVQSQPDHHFVEVFTTRPDTLFGATFLVVSPELAKKWIDIGWSASKAVRDYVTQSLNRKERDRLENAGEKTGVDSEITAINPATKEEIPVWVADYVLGGYGTGAIMAVPAHDERDFEFAKKFSLPIRQVIEPVYIQTTEPGKVIEGLQFDERNAIIAIVKHWSEDKYIGLKWKKVAWGTFITGGIEKGQTAEEAAKTEIKEETGYLNPKLIKDFGVIHGKFYHVPKKVNRFAHARALYFELQDDRREEISGEEKDIHEVKWLTKEELVKFLTPDTHLHALRILTGTQDAYSGEGIMVNSGKFDGLSSEAARWEITKFVGGEKQVQYKIRDWSVSRQRYWGVPIPMIHCNGCGTIPVPDKDLPVKLPVLKDYRPKGIPPLASSKKFLQVNCPDCGGKAQRDAETLDTFVDSSWYFLRYTDPSNKRKFADEKKIQTWMPIQLYVIGAEHTNLHLLYSRFITKFLSDQGYLKFKEPFLKLRHVGLIQGSDGQKMSKSRGNVVNPDPLVQEYGADAVRLYEMFMGPFEDGQPWDTKGVIGTYRFLNRVWNLYQRLPKKSSAGAGSPVLPLVHRTIKQVSSDIENLKFNTGVSELMKLLNVLEKQDDLSPFVRESFLKIMAPFAPHLTEELWMNVLGEPRRLKESGSRPQASGKSIHTESWPEYDDRLLAQEQISIAVQVNGKVRDVLTVSPEATEDEILDLALISESVKRHIAGKEIIKTIFVPRKMLSIVVKE